MVVKTMTMNLKNKSVKRYFIIPVDVSNSGQIVSIDKKIPRHLKHCTGIRFSVKTFLDVAQDIPQLGEISLLLNSGQVHPIHHFTSYSKEILDKGKKDISISEPLTTNQIITGYYRDLKAAVDIRGVFQPYILNIYLICKATI